MKPFYRLLILGLAIGGCGTAESADGVSRDAPPAAAVLAPGEAGDLVEELRRMISELDLAVTEDPERILTAEAISDRLMQARRPTDWLRSGYDVEARLRQIQTMADRLVAILRRGSPMTRVEPDVRTLQLAASNLLEEIERSGARSRPPPLDTLLARVGREDDAGLSQLPRVAPPPATAPEEEAADEAATPQTGAPLGVPVPDTTGGGRPEG